MPLVKLEVLSARNVPEGDYIARITCGKTKLKTKAIKKTSFPEWNEKFELTVAESDTIQIEIELSKKFGSKSLGVAEVPLTNVTRGKERIWWEKKGLVNDVSCAQDMAEKYCRQRSDCL